MNIIIITIHGIFPIVTAIYTLYTCDRTGTNTTGLPTPSCLRPPPTPMMYIIIGFCAIVVNDSIQSTTHTALNAPPPTLLTTVT